MNTVTLLSSYFWSDMGSTTTIYCYYTVNHFKNKNVAPEQFMSSTFLTFVFSFENVPSMMIQITRIVTIEDGIKQTDQILSFLYEKNWKFDEKFFISALQEYQNYKVDVQNSNP